MGSFWYLLAFQFIFFLTGVPAFALTLDQAFEALRDRGTNYAASSGAICEDVAMLVYKDYYPERRYEVLTRVAYVDRKTQQAGGEFDLVVVEKGTGNATPSVVEVVEVKCWEDLGAAFSKALSQRDHYFRSLQNTEQFKYISLDLKSEILEPRQFSNFPRYTTMSQYGGRRTGFEEVLPFSLDELKSLGDRITRCQEQKRCLMPPLTKRQRKASRSQSFP